MPILLFDFFVGRSFILGDLILLLGESKAASVVLTEFNVARFYRPDNFFNLLLLGEFYRVVSIFYCYLPAFLGVSNYFSGGGCDIFGMK